MKQIFVIPLLCLTSCAFANINAIEVEGLVKQNLHQASIPAQPTTSIPAPFIQTAPVSSQGKLLGVETLGNRYELVVFFLTTCPHCARFLPIVKAYGQEHNIKVIAFSEDGRGDLAYPTPLPVTPEIMTHFGDPLSFPALFLVDKNDSHAKPIPIAVGEEPASILEEQMQQVAQSLGVSV